MDFYKLLYLTACQSLTPLLQSVYREVGSRAQAETGMSVSIEQYGMTGNGGDEQQEGWQGLALFSQCSPQLF